MLVTGIVAGVITQTVKLRHPAAWACVLPSAVYAEIASVLRSAVLWRRLRGRCIIVLCLISSTLSHEPYSTFPICVCFRFSRSTTRLRKTINTYFNHLPAVLCADPIFQPPAHVYTTNDNLNRPYDKSLFAVAPRGFPSLVDRTSPSTVTECGSQYHPL